MSQHIETSGQTIPDSVLDQIVAHRPHLAGLVHNLRAMPMYAATIEKAIASNYCAGETRLSATDSYDLSACCVGHKFGGGRRDAKGEKR